MFDTVGKHKIIISVILFLISIPFAFFGIDFYFRGGDAAGQVAKVGGEPITGREFEQALQQRQEQLRRAMQGRVDNTMLNSPEVRQAVLNQLVDDRLTYAAARKSGISVTTDELQKVIASVPAFRENGGSGPFSRRLYEAALRSQGLSEAGFEAMLRKDLVLNRARGALAATAFTPNAVLDRLYKLRGEQREVSQQAFAPEEFLAKVKVEPGEAQAFYDAHKSEFRVPEKVKIEYTLLSLDRIQQQVQITPEQLKQYYEEHKAQFETPEERRARHILVSAAASATPEQKAKAKAKAEALLAEVKKAPNSFAEVAKKNSEDPGSAAEGGDLGFFPRGRMVKAFDDAVFGAKPGDVVGPVETQFGYHVIRLEEVKAGGTGPGFEAVKAQAETELRKQESGRKFAEAAENFSNLIYEQPDSLEPAVKQFGLTLQKSSGWLSREGGAPDDPLLNNQKFINAVFADDVVKDHRNSEAVEIAQNVLVAARVIDHAAAKERPFGEVQADIVKHLTREKAGKLAKEAGEARLAQLKKGEAAGSWTPPQMLSRDRPGELQPDAARAVFSADAAKLPAYAAAQVGEKYFVYRITKVNDGPPVDPGQRKALARQIDQAAGMEAGTAANGSLRKRLDVKVNPKAIQPSKSGRPPGSAGVAVEVRHLRESIRRRLPIVSRQSTRRGRFRGWTSTRA